MITALIVCITVVLCIVWLTLWVTYMSKHSLPMWLFAECVHKEENYAPTTPPIGFQADPDSDETDKAAEKELSDRELRDQLLSDTASTISALLRGEVDFDDIKQ